MDTEAASRTEREKKASQFKASIIESAQRGVFDQNPLLSTTHYVTCRGCHHKQSLIYLQYLKTGNFAFGRTAQIEALSFQGPIGYLETERVTPIIITLLCDNCKGHIEVKPVNAEYLYAIINRPKTLRTLYV